MKKAFTINTLVVLALFAISACRTSPAQHSSGVAPEGIGVASLAGTDPTQARIVAFARAVTNMLDLDAVNNDIIPDVLDYVSYSSGITTSFQETPFDVALTGASIIDNTLMGIGVVGTEMATVSIARKIARTRAMADISHQLGATVSSSMISEWPDDPLAFRDATTRTISASTLQGAFIVDEAIINGEYVVVVMQPH